MLCLMAGLDSLWQCFRWRGIEIEFRKVIMGFMRCFHRMKDQSSQVHSDQMHAWISVCKFPL